MLRWWDWPVAFLLLAALITATARLDATEWTDHLPLVGKVALFGGVAGLLLGQSRFHPLLVQVFAWLYGLFIVPWRLGLIQGTGIAWLERLHSLGNRLLITSIQLVNRQPVTDNLFFLCLMATLFWTMSVYAGYSITRHGAPWRAVLPAGLSIVIIHAYDHTISLRVWYMAAYIFFALLLVARLNYLQQQRRWKINHSYLPPLLGMDSIRVALYTTAILVLLAWTTPATASTLQMAKRVWEPLQVQWYKIRDNLSNAFSALQATVDIVTEYYGTTLDLGRGTPLSDAVVMIVQAPPTHGSVPQYYWRARVYDLYNGRWTSTLTTKHALTPNNNDLIFPNYTGRITETFTIETKNPIQTLYTPAQPIWVSRPSEATLGYNSDGTADLSSMIAKPFLHAGDLYQVKTSLSTPTIAELRASGTDYPDWVISRYLTLPASITPRTHQLAMDITAGLETPYDKVQAITDYLRSNLQYVQTLPLPPDGVEPIDWILFTYKKAFCNYYATAEIILLRSVGIPARLAVGYASGESRATSIWKQSPGDVEQSGPEGIVFTVRHRDAHSWPEIYFNGLGWVEFEPTASLAPINRPLDKNPPENSNNSPIYRGNTNQPDFGRFPAPDDANPLPTKIKPAPGKKIPLAIIVAGVIALSVLLILMIRRVRKQRNSLPISIQLESGFLKVGVKPPRVIRQWAHHTRLSVTARAYLEINHALIRLGSPPKLPNTPAERAAVLSQILPQSAYPIQTLLGVYQSTTYGLNPGNDTLAHFAGQTIRKQSYLTLINRWFTRVQRLLKTKESN